MNFGLDDLVDVASVLPPRQFPQALVEPLCLGDRLNPGHIPLSRIRGDTVVETHKYGRHVDLTRWAAADDLPMSAVCVVGRIVDDGRSHRVQVHV
jgi:hypothetical protein